MSQEIAKILLVEDSPLQAKVIKDCLENKEGTCFELNHVADLQQGLNAVSENTFDVILLDLTLPDSEGLDTAAKMLAKTPNTPVIILSALEDDPKLFVEAARIGAQDFIIKTEIKPQILPRSILFAIERYKKYH